ncbi:hypothetical protein [Rhizobium ruizarguesonis]|nr:hypothetical protein [Rhizobium ruizarguesonis]NEJ64904.1 hypothetical protein [Rhizobium ruizarguesonis]
MNDETKHLSQTLVFTLRVIIDSDAEKDGGSLLTHQEDEFLLATTP